METQSSDDDGASPAEYPRWVLLDQSARYADHNGDANTVAVAITSSGHLLRFSFQFRATPAISRVRLDHPGPPPDDEVTFDFKIVSAHRDSVLVEVHTMPVPHNGHPIATDYFIYSAGAGGTSRQPSLFLLPPCYISRRHEEEEITHRERRQRYMDYRSTAIMCRKNDTPLVANLYFWANNVNQLDGELCLFRSGEWEVKRRVPVHHDKEKAKELSYLDETDMVIAVRDRFLYWVDLLRGIIFADVSEKDPVLRYVSLPVKPLLRRRSKEYVEGPERDRRVCVTGGNRSTVRFVEVASRCCCGGPGTTSCARSRYAFTVTTWTLRMDGMTWEKDGVVDCEELWTLHGYQGVPRVRPSRPIVSLEDPDVICLDVCRDSYMCDDDEEDATWVIEVNTRRKKLRSVRYDGGLYHLDFHPSELSKYFKKLLDS